MDFDPKKNYYEILWVWEDATQDEIKKAFRKWAVKYHPDRWGSKEKFQEINEAYQVLSNEKTKQQYDVYRKWWFWAWWFWWWGFDFWWFWWWWAWVQIDFWDIWDLLGWMFWGGFWWSRKRRATKWDDLEKHIEISFEDSYLWVKKKISYTRKKKVDWIVSEQCQNCKWSWRISQQSQTMFWTFQTQVACPECWWLWEIYKKDWKKLENWWFVDVKEIIELDIPAWIKNWSYLKYSEKGNEWIWTLPSWDLFVKILVKDSTKYQRKEDDLYVNAEISLFDLVLWWEVEVPHPEWKMKVKVPKWTQIWQKIRVTWKWFGEKWLFKKKWDMIVNLQVSIPKRLTKDQEKLWKDLQKIS